MVKEDGNPGDGEALLVVCAEVVVARAAAAALSNNMFGTEVRTEEASNRKLGVPPSKAVVALFPLFVRRPGEGEFSGAARVGGTNKDGSLCVMETVGAVAGGLLLLP